MKINPHRGKLIVFEGLDGSGQTTQAQLLAKWFRDKRDQYAYYTKEPTDGPIGAILKLILSKRLYCSINGSKEPRRHDEVTMALCFAADRADHLHNEVVPKLKEGFHVIADRYYLSSLAYQSVDADYDWLRQINQHTLRPDLTLFLDVPPTICIKRMRAQRWHVELYEDLRTLEKVRYNFMSAIAKSKIAGEQIEIINGDQPSRDVHKAIVHSIKNFFRSAVIPFPQNHKEQVPEQAQLDLLNKAEPLTEQEIAEYQAG